MESKIEGLLIHKVIQGDRNIVSKLLLRSGRVVSVIFYGGLGGGKKMKPSVLELGYMLKVDLKEGNLKSSEMFTAKEWQVLWKYSNIRFNHEAYYLMCFFLEIATKISSQDDLFDKNREFDKSLEGIFRVLSNAIFYLEDSLINKRFNPSIQLSLFIIKMVFELGINPQMDGCIFCKADFEKLSEIFLVPDHGGFGCTSCIGISSKDEMKKMPDGGKDLFNLFKIISSLKYQDYQALTAPNRELNHLLLNYFFYQLGLEKNSFKTISFVL